MNKMKLKQEGEKWVAEGIISKAQLEKILTKYDHKDPNFVIILFAILLSALGFITYIMSDWAQVPHFSRVLIILIAIAALYWLGDYLFRRRSSILGTSFIILGYIVFGVGMLLTISIFNVQLFSTWTFVVWSIVGLLLYFIYEHGLIFVVGIIVMTVGQIYSGVHYSSIDWLLLLVLLFGYAHFVYHHAKPLFGYAFAISFSIQMVVLTMAEAQQYYWPIVYFLLLYIIGEILPKKALRNAFKHVSLLSIFIFGMYQSFLLQEAFFLSKIEYLTSFIIIWIVLMVIGIFIKIRNTNRWELIDFILFLPVHLLPFSFIIGLISLFVFSLVWLWSGYRDEDHEKITIGTIAFLLGTLTVYIQYAWDALNKSLFFLIGGILLFSISFFLEKQRRALISDGKGGDDQ